MHSKFVISTILFSSASVLAQKPIQFFNFYPAQKCNDGSFDICEETDEDAYEAIKRCGDGTYCSSATCGTWLGKEKMCCGGTANLDAEGSIINQLVEACTPYKDELENFDIESSSVSEPLKGDQCKDPLKTFGVGVGANETGEFLSGNTTTYKSCCSSTDTAITVYSDFLNTVDTAGCAPSLEGGSSGGSSSGGSSDKSLGANLTPSVGRLIISSVLAALAGFAVML